MRDQTLGPKPTKNSVTLMSKARATPKCAASWITITRIRTTMKAPTPSSCIAADLPDLDDLGGASTGPRVGPLEVHHRGHRGGRLVLVHDRRHDLDDAGERDLALEEGHDRDLVGRAHDRGEGEPELAHAVGEVDRREGFPVDRLERQLAIGERHRTHASRKPLGPPERALDRPPHIGAPRTCR